MNGSPGFSAPYGERNNPLSGNNTFLFLIAFREASEEHCRAVFYTVLYHPISTNKISCGSKRPFARWRVNRH